MKNINILATETEKKQKYSIKAHLFQMCLVFSKELNFKGILGLEATADRKDYAAAYRAYDSLLYVLKKEKPVNKFSNPKTVELLNAKLMQFWKAFNESSIKAISES